jgi:hypothetical protein
MSKRMEILQKIESGELTPDEGAKLLENLGQLSENLESVPKTDLDILSLIESGEMTAEEAISELSEKNQSSNDYNEEESGDDSKEEVSVNILQSTTPPISDEELNKWKNIWQIPLYIGLVVTMISAAWMNGQYQSHQGVSFWFFFALLPLSLGILLLVISWNSQNGPWVHVRVKQEKQKIAISFPLFIKLTGNFVRKFGIYIDQIPNSNIEDLANAVDDLFSPDNPLEINVDNKEDNEEVKIYIG